MTIKYSADFADFLMRQPKKFLEQSQLMQQLKGGRMNRIAAEIAIEIRVLLQNDDVNSGSGEEKARHHSRRSAADNKAATAGFRDGIHG